MLSWSDSESVRHALIDLGRSKDYRTLKPVLKKIAKIDLVTFSHIDADHISGAVAMFKESLPPFEAKHIWFNAHLQLENANKRLPPDKRITLGVAQAEKVTEGIIKRQWPWNAHFQSGIVSRDSTEAQRAIPFDGGLAITLLSPNDSNLAELLPVWNAELKKANLRTVDPDEVQEALSSGRVILGGLNVEELALAEFNEDETKPNGSSISFIAEHGGKRILLGADAHPSVLEASLRSLGASEDKRFVLDCFKLPHHGSKANVSPSLLKIIDCKRFAFSTDGTRHQHPNPETIARILTADPLREKTLIFNFRQNQTTQWETAELMTQWNYKCVFPDDGEAGVQIDI